MPIRSRSLNLWRPVPAVCAPERASTPRLRRVLISVANTSGQISSVGKVRSIAPPTGDAVCRVRLGVISASIPSQSLDVWALAVLGPHVKRVRLILALHQ